MLNSGYKKEAIARLGQASNHYQQTYNNTMDEIVSLHDKRIDAAKVIKDVEKFINSLANTPKDYEKTIIDIKVNRQKFEAEVHRLELESKQANKVSGGIVQERLYLHWQVLSVRP